MELTYSTFIVIFIFLSQQDSFMGRLVDLLISTLLVI